MLRMDLKQLKSRVIPVLIALMTVSVMTAQAADEATKPVDLSLQDLKFGLTGYFELVSGQTPIPEADQEDQEENYNKFQLNRGYIRFSKPLTPYLTAKITTDIYQDSKNGLVVRLKYYYGEFKLPTLGPLTNIISEVGMGHTAWLDFEDSINPYRCQGLMPIERAGVVSSADLGVNVMGYFGGKLENAKKLTGHDKFAGRFGSWHIGVINGSGYSGIENNQNKVVEGRLTLRPLSMIDLLAGLQLSYFGVYGEGNTMFTDADGHDYWPEFTSHLGMVSYEHPYITVSGQYFQGAGNYKGEWVFTNEDGDPQEFETKGYSAFVNIRPPVLDKKIAVFGRYDYFDMDEGDEIYHPETVNHKEKDAETSYNTIIGGISYDFYKGNMIVVSYEQTQFDDDSNLKGKNPVLENKLGDENKFQVILQIKL